MTAPLVTIVVETVTAREHGETGPLADRIAGCLAAIGRQTYSEEAIDTVVVLDGEVTAADREMIAERYNYVRLVCAAASNYFAAKNAGAEAAKGSYVALVDADCEPEPDWLAGLMSRMEPEVSVVTGRTRYKGRSWTERLCSVSDFGTIHDAGGGLASGIMLNNVLYRREVLTDHPLDSRIPRNGGCFLQFHQLRAAGARILYEPAAQVAHGDDVHDGGYVRKHFDRGYDSIAIYQLDEPPVLGGTRLFSRFGRPVLVAFTARRIWLDLVRLARNRRQLEFGLARVALQWLVGAGLRVVELCGAFSAVAAAKRGRRAGTRGSELAEDSR